MHAEYAHLPASTATLINNTKSAGGRIIAVGTTVTRTLETAHLHRIHGELVEFLGDTQIFIYPPYEFGVVDCLITNFHLPKSTLLMLVSAFAGTQTIQKLTIMPSKTNTVSLAMAMRCFWKKPSNMSLQPIWLTLVDTKIMPD